MNETNFCIKCRRAGIMKPKKLQDLLSDIDNIGASEIACFACNGDPSNKHEFEVIELLEAYAMSLEKENKNKIMSKPILDEQRARQIPSLKEQMDKPKFELLPAWSEDEYILASNLWKIFKSNQGTSGKKMAITEIREFIKRGGGI